MSSLRDSLLSSLAGTEESAVQLWQIQHAYPAKGKEWAMESCLFWMESDFLLSPALLTPADHALTKGKRSELEFVSPCAHARHCSSCSDVSKMGIW